MAYPSCGEQDGLDAAELDHLQHGAQVAALERLPSSERERRVIATGTARRRTRAGDGSKGAGARAFARTRARAIVIKNAALVVVHSFPSEQISK